jgi:uncharacterized protein
MPFVCRVVITVAAVLSLSLVASSQTSSSDSQDVPQATPQAQATHEAITPEEKEAREKAYIEMAQAQMPREQFDKMMKAARTAMLAQMQAHAQRAGSPVPAEELEKMSKSLDNIISYDEVVLWAADIYASHFTVDEINQIRDFYKTPVGEKLVRLQPEMMQETMNKMFTVVDQRAVAAMQKSAPKTGPDR